VVLLSLKAFIDRAWVMVVAGRSEGLSMAYLSQEATILWVLLLVRFVEKFK
jgi:hypothetical protein